MGIESDEGTPKKEDEEMGRPTAHSEAKPEVPATSPEIRSEKASAGILPKGLTTVPLPDSDIVLLVFDSDHLHPADPLGWRPLRRWLIMFGAATCVMSIALASSLPTAASSSIAAELGGFQPLVLSTFLFGYCGGPFVFGPLSESFGRRPVLLVAHIAITGFTGGSIAAKSYGTLLATRFLAGFFASAPNVISGSLCGDIFTARDRGNAMSYYSVATFSGPALGPVLGSFIALRAGWRMGFVVLTALSGAITLGMIVGLPETYAPVILSSLARDLRAKTGSSTIMSKLEHEALLIRKIPRARRLKANVARLFGRPFHMLFTELICFLLTLYAALLYGLIYVLFEMYPVIFVEIHKIPQGLSSLPFITTLIGAVLSVPITLWFQKKYLRDVAANGGVGTPEMRLPQASWGGVLVPISFLWLGWSGYRPSVSPVWPALSGIPQGVASVLIFRALQTYLIDAYEVYSASALAANVVARSMMGGVFPIFFSDLVKKLGVEWTATAFAGAMLVLVPVPFIFEKYGARLRKNSRYCPSD